MSIDCQWLVKFFRPLSGGRKNAGKRSETGGSHDHQKSRKELRARELQKFRAWVVAGRGFQGVFPASLWGWPENQPLSVNDLQNFSGVAGKFRALAGKFRRSLYRDRKNRRTDPRPAHPSPAPPPHSINEGMFSGPTLGLGRKTTLLGEVGDLKTLSLVREVLAMVEPQTQGNEMKNEVEKTREVEIAWTRRYRAYAEAVLPVVVEKLWNEEMDCFDTLNDTTEITNQIAKKMADEEIAVMSRRAGMRAWREA